MGVQLSPSLNRNIVRGSADRLTTAEVLATFQGSNLIPTTRKEYRSMLAEAFLTLLEILAFGEHLEKRGELKQDGWEQALHIALKALKDHLTDTGYWQERKES